MPESRCFPFSGKCKVTSPFGPRNPVATPDGGYSSSNHVGIDFAPTTSDKNALACSNGVVKRVIYTNKGTGNYVFIATEDGYGLFYCHLNKIFVKVGDKVSTKQLIAEIGNTGKSTGTHLHFGVSTNTEYNTGYYTNPWIDPRTYLGISIANRNLVGKVFEGSGYVSVVIGENQKDVNQNELDPKGVKEEIDRVRGYSSGELSGDNGEYYKIDNLRGISKDILYGRRYRIIVALNNNNALDVSYLRCVFRIQKHSYREPQNSILTIYNLNPNDENKIIKYGSRMIIEAGYNGSFYGKIFDGQIVQPIREKENGTDYKLTLISMDSERYINKGIIGISLVAQQSSRDAISALSDRSSVKCETGIISDTQIHYPRGKVMFGKSADYLNQIAKSENATFYVENQKINIVKAGSLSTNEIFDLSPSSGLLGSPEQYQYGVKFRCLLNPMIDVYSRVHIDNRKIKGMEYSYGEPIRSLDNEGIYKVVSLTYSGDTRGTDWSIDAEAVTQSGTLPAMAVGQDLFVFGN